MTLPLAIRPAGKADVDAMTVLPDRLFAIEKDFTPDTERQRRGLLLLLETPRTRAFVAARAARAGSQERGLHYDKSYSITDLLTANPLPQPRIRGRKGLSLRGKKKGSWCLLAAPSVSYDTESHTPLPLR